VFTWIALAERVAQRRIYPQAVFLPAVFETRREALRSALCCVVYFDQPVVGVSFRASDLADDNPAGDPRLYQLLREYADDRLSASSEGASMVSRLTTALRALEDIADASAETLAAELGLGVRTLHRRLRAEGRSYRQVLEDFRMQRCLSQLASASVSAKRLAFSLGFSSPASFHRAFRRWTGQTVSEYRRALHRGAHAGPEERAAS
jgi:AraC-like DNA-binding protein